MAEKGILPLLRDISRMLASSERPLLKEKALICLGDRLGTSACAVYLRESAQVFSLYKSYCRRGESKEHFCPDLSPAQLGATPLFMAAGEGEGLFAQKDAGPSLSLPFLQENRLEGFLLARWPKGFSPDVLTEEDFSLLETLAQLLTYAYCASSGQRREHSLWKLYQQAEQTLEDYQRNTSTLLHDQVDQLLISVLLQLNALQQNDNLEFIQGRLKGLEHMTKQALAEVRRVVGNPGLYLLERVEVNALIQAVSEEYAKSFGLAVDSSFYPEEIEISTRLEILLLQAVREGLKWAAQYSAESRVSLTLTLKNQKLFLQIADIGREPEESRVEDLSMIAVQEKVQEAGGKFWFLREREPEPGLALNILLPLD